MQLQELTTVPDAALPIAALKTHLRLGNGYAMAPDEEPLLASYLRAALAAIEGRIGKMLFQRRFALRLEVWPGAEGQRLPLVPFAKLVSVARIDGAGTAELVDPARWRVNRRCDPPRLMAQGAGFPPLAEEYTVEVVFEAGFGPFWTSLPADLGQAVLLLAAEFYEHRHEETSFAQGFPSRVAALIEGWRQVRVLGGGRAR